MGQVLRRTGSGPPTPAAGRLPLAGTSLPRLSVGRKRLAWGGPGAARCIHGWTSHGYHADPSWSEHELTADSVKPRDRSPVSRLGLMNSVKAIPTNRTRQRCVLTECRAQLHQEAVHPARRPRQLPPSPRCPAPLRPWRSSMGRRTCHRLAPRIPPTPHPVGTTRRHFWSLPRPRHLLDHPQTRPTPLLGPLMGCTQ